MSGYEGSRDAELSSRTVDRLSNHMKSKVVSAQLWVELTKSRTRHVVRVYAGVGGLATVLRERELLSEDEAKMEFRRWDRLLSGE